MIWVIGAWYTRWLMEENRMINLLPWREELALKRQKHRLWMSAILIGTLVFIMITLTYYYSHSASEKTNDAPFRFTLPKIPDKKNSPLKKKRLKVIIKKKAIEKPRSIVLLPINNAKAEDILHVLSASSQDLISQRGAIGMDPRTNSIWIFETVSRQKTVQALIKSLDTVMPQVVIEARIVNMSKNCEKDLGIRFGAAGGLISSIPVTEKLHVDFGATGVETPPATLGFALATLNDKVLLDLELSALESEGHAKVIASPRLMTVNRQSAVIKAGEDIPYQEFSGNGGTAISFKQAVMRLKVTPQIMSQDRLILDLIINENADSGQRVQGVPVILTKSIQTHVMVRNGQTIVLGGIYKQNNVKHRVRVPFLGQIPGVGWLFQQKMLQIRQEELLIFITPRIIDRII